MDNKELARVFEEYADVLELQDSNPFRIRSLRRAAQIFESLTFDAVAALEEDPARLESIPGIGSGTLSKIRELLEKGTIAEYQEIKSRIPASLLTLLQLQNLGPRKIALFWKELQISNLDELLKAAQEGRLRELQGMGEKSEQKIIKAIAEYRGRQGRFRLDEGIEMSEALIRYLQSSLKIRRIAAAGSVRRRRETIGDLDILVSCDSPRQAIKAFVGHPDAQEVLAEGETKASIRLRRDLQADLRVLDDESFGAALQYFTGSKEHNVSLRSRARRMGFKISEYGLFQVKDEKKAAGENEEDIYRHLKMDYIEPEMRENRGEIEAAQQGRLPRLIEEKDIRGDLHMHTTASDGKDSIEVMAEAARARGYDYVAITDHSKALAMTRGLDEKRLLKHIDAIDEVISRKPGIHILKGIEVDILADGSLDLSDEVLSRLDIVIASIHSRFNLARQEMTQRICRAIENPLVNILAHPTGRLLTRREPYQVDLEEVVKVAVENRVCLEINAYPARLDLSDVHCRMARDRGALISINSDSHNTGMLQYMTYGIYTARRGWLEAGDVINTFPLTKLRKVLTKQLYRQAG